MIPPPFDVVIDVANLFDYDPALGDLLVDIEMRNSPLTTFFDISAFPSDAVRRIYQTSVTNPIGQGPFANGLVTRFDMIPPPLADWYEVNVEDTANVLHLSTRTPADGTGEFLNNFNPRIEVFDPSGNSVALGLPGADGRNETVSLQPGVAGKYRVKVTGENSSLGTYFLAMNFGPVVENVTVSASINEGEAATISGTITDPDALDSHTVVIDWGPGRAAPHSTCPPA